MRSRRLLVSLLILQLVFSPAAFGEVKLDTSNLAPPMVLMAAMNHGRSAASFFGNASHLEHIARSFKMQPATTIALLSHESFWFYFGNACTGSTTGNWATAGSWTTCGGTFPGSGDTAKINNTIVITVAVSTTAIVGISAADNTTEAIGCTDPTATGTGRLIVNGTLIFKGVINQCNGTWTIGAGATITHDSSVNPAQHYAWIVGLNNATAAKIDATAGTSGSHIIFNIAGGSGYAGGTHGTNCSVSCGGNGSWFCTFCDVSDWGGNSASFKLMEYSGTAATDGFLWTNSTCVRCGQMDSWNVGANANFSATNSRFISPNLASGACAINVDGSGNLISTTFTGGSRSFANSVIVGGMSVASSTFVRGSSIHLTLSSTVLASTTGAGDCAPYVGNRSYTVDTCQNVIFFNAIQAQGRPEEMPGGTNCTRILFLNTGNTTNSHFVDAIVATTTLDGFIAQLEGDQGAGASNADLFQTQTSPTAAFPVTFKHGISLPDGGGHAIGTFTNHSAPLAPACDGATTFCPVFTIENNTYGGTDSGTLAIGATGEVGTGFAGLYASIRNNLVYFGTTGSTFNAGTAWTTKWHTSVTPVAGTFANADFNGCINCTAGTANRYFRSVSDPTEYTIAPGTHDVSVVSAGFVDSTREFVKWCKTQDAGVTNFTTCLADFNNGTISTSQITNLYTYIVNGWAPTNSALKGKGYDGSDLGAVPVVLGGRRRGQTIAQFAPNPHVVLGMWRRMSLEVRAA